VSNAPRRALDALRQRARHELRWRLAGDDAERHHDEIWNSQGDRRFGPGDPVWRVHADASMFIGGLRALLLQSLHPVAMHAVAAHSDYRRDPWGRLNRTAHFLAATTYGDERVAEAAIERVRRIHAAVRGVTPDGRPYAADDPHLLEWVHVAEVDSFLRAHQAFGSARLTDSDADEYVAQTGEVAIALGVVDPPASRDDLRRRLRAYRPELRSTTAAREAARFLVLQPPLPLVARPVYGALAAAAVTSLPAWASLGLGLGRLPFDDRLVGRPAGGLVTSALRWAMT